MSEVAAEVVIDAQKWLNERHQPGNWTAVAPDEEIPLSITGWDRTIINIFQVAFTPEIERRRAAGSLPDDFFVLSAQLLQPEDGPKVVRFNDEVKGVLRLDLEDGAPGRQLALEDIGRMVSFDLAEDELDAGHFTVFWNGRSWSGAFDFRSGRARSGQLVANALHFIDTARFAVERGFPGPAVDNLFSGCELISKVELILHNLVEARTKSHKNVSSQINNWARLGNADPAFVRLFNRLSKDRDEARYKSTGDVTMPTVAELDLAESIATNLASEIRQRG